MNTTPSTTATTTEKVIVAPAADDATYNAAVDAAYEAERAAARTAARTDVHRPAVLVTEDYSYIAAFDIQAPFWAGSDFALDISRKVRQSTLGGERGMSQCHHCGAHIRYVAVLEHLPTGEFIAVGETCLENRFERATGEFHALRKQAQLDRQAQRIRTAVAEFVTSNPDLAWMGDKENNGAPELPDFCFDIARKLRRYGELSERQVAAVRKCMAGAVKLAEMKAAQADEPKVPCPEGKQTITGVIVSLKWQDSQYGSTLKMVVKDDRGFAVWSTVPASLPNSERGDRVTFTATLTRSDRDEAFGFAKRPTKAVCLQEAADTAE